MFEEVLTSIYYISNMYSTLHEYYIYKQKSIIMYEIKLLQLNNCKNSIYCTKSHDSDVKICYSTMS